MKIMKGKEIDIEIIDVVEKWVEEEEYFTHNWRIDELIEEKTLTAQFEAPEALEFILIISFPFCSEASGETYNDIYSFVEALFLSIQEGIALSEWQTIPTIKWDINLVVEKSYHFFKSKNDSYAHQEAVQYVLNVGVASI